MLKNITKGFKTTTIGLLLMGIAVYALLFKGNLQGIDTRTYVSACCIVLMLGIALLLCPDTLIDALIRLIKKVAVIVVLVGIIGIGSISCKPCKSIVTQVRITDTVFVPGASVDTLFNTTLSDSLWVSKGRLRLAIRQDSLPAPNGKISQKHLRIKAACLPDTIFNNHTVTVQVPVRYEPIVVDKGGFKKWYWLALIGFVIGILIKR